MASPMPREWPVTTAAAVFGSIGVMLEDDGAAKELFGGYETVSGGIRRPRFGRRLGVDGRHALHGL